MLCSISTGKSGSNWLDRLRSSKGFPSGNDLDLDHFLNNHNPNPPNSPNNIASDPKSNSGSSHSDPKPVHNHNQTTEISTGENEWFGIMTNVLSELFIMGDTKEIPRFSGKKSSRKQTNPKICVLSVDDERCLNDVRRDETVPSSGDNSLMETKELKKEANGDCVDVEVEEEEEEKYNNGELLGYSRSEVTIIDTSYEYWKCEKLLFRRKNVWRIREKKGKSSSSLSSNNVGDKKKKKRKESLCDENVGGKKKAKVSILPFGPSKKDENGGDRLVPSNEGQHSKNDKREEAYKKTPDTLNQDPKRRFPFPRSARKSRKGCSSVIHINGTPKSKKNGANFSSICVKDTQRQSKA